MIETLKDFISDNSQLVVICVCFGALVLFWAGGNNSRWLFGRNGARKGTRIAVCVFAGAVLAAGLYWLQTYSYR